MLLPKLKLRLNDFAGICRHLLEQAIKRGADIEGVDFIATCCSLVAQEPGNQLLALGRDVGYVLSEGRRVIQSIAP